MPAITSFKSHIDGRNADVHIHDDHIEWARKGRVSALKVATGVALVKGARLSRNVEFIPIRNISSVTLHRDGIRFSQVRIIATGNTINFRVSHSDAPWIVDAVKRLMLGTHPSQVPQRVAQVQSVIVQPAAVPVPVAVPSIPPVSTADELLKLVKLRDAGALTEAEFAEQKSLVLGTPGSPPLELHPHALAQRASSEFDREPLQLDRPTSTPDPQPAKFQLPATELAEIPQPVAAMQMPLPRSNTPLGMSIGIGPLGRSAGP